MIMRILRNLILAGFAAIVSISCEKSTPQFNYVDYVDPYIGTDFHGHVFLGANVPYGAVQLGPTNFVKGWDWCSGYHYSDSVMHGFSHTHLSGTGIGDLGDVLIMPYTGKLMIDPGKQEDISNGYASYYSHDFEVARPGYYQVDLLSTGISVELTTTERVGVHRYKFPGNDVSRMIVDLRAGIGWDNVTQAHLRKVDDKTYTGYRYSRGWAPDQRLFFAIEISEAPAELNLFNRTDEEIALESEDKAMKAVFTFAGTGKKEILLKVGISPVSEENALANIKAEVPHWDFDKVVTDATQKWNTELAKIDVKSDDLAELRTFYTAMYHLMIHPSLFNDANGEYRGTDKEVYPNPGFNNYTVFSLWDTYRAAHPLFTILDPDRVNDFVKSMMSIYDHQGSLPVWHLMGCETGTMVGNHSIPVIADAFFKGIGNFDPHKALDAMIVTANHDDGDGLPYVAEIGYVPADKTRESVSKGLEYAVDDWAIAKMAKELGREDVYKLFMERAGFYRNYYDPEVGFFRGKNYDGTWNEPFHPVYTIHEEGNYTEGNAWQYLWMVPQDPEGLIDLLGGEEIFVHRLDSLFIIPSELNEGASPDISGLIGQYAQGNEPSHHTVYLYAYAGQQWKTAEKIRYILEHHYTDQPDGIIGNEDCGQMSAWYIFSSLGFYPVNPSNSAYVFGSPLHEEATINLSNGRKFTVKSVNNSKDNIYIQSVSLNGKPYEKSFITHGDIMKGGVLEFVMGSSPNKAFGTSPENRPKSVVYK
jgi:predicted alpha-1,2-mannosidase